MSEAEDCPKNEQLAEKRSFESNCEILRTVFQPRALSFDIPASQKGVYLFYNPPINFLQRARFIYCGAHLQLNKSKLVSLLDFITL